MESVTYPAFLRIEFLPGKTLVGQKIQTSFANNQTRLLWSGFMPKRKTITDAISNDLYAVQIYPNGMPSDPTEIFVKWATMEVNAGATVPEGMEVLQLPPGNYAVFLHKGSAATGPQAFRYIFMEWLPASGHKLDDRPHFEILGAAYKNDDPQSEEEIWIPVK